MKKKDYSYVGLMLLVEVRVSVLRTRVFVLGRPRKSHLTTGVLGYASSLTGTAS